MWSAVREGLFSNFSTDHAPSTAAQKQADDFWSAPFRLLGLDTTYPFLIDAALKERITLQELVVLSSASPASRYGLAHRKGRIAVGADADLVLVDPHADWEVSDTDIISKAGWSPYAGRRFRGRVVATYLRGHLVAEDGEPLDERSGLFLPSPCGP